MKVQRLQRLLLFMMVLLIFTVSTITPLKANAHDAYFLQVLIDENRYLYKASVLQDKASFWSKESKHYEASLGDFGELKDWNGGRSTISTNEDDYEESSTDGTDSMMFTFPSKEDGGLLSSKAKNNAEAKDAERAYLIMETLVPGLNDALIILNDGKSFENIEDLIKMASKLSSGSVDGFTIEYGKRMTGASPLKESQKKEGIKNEDFVVITNNKTGEQYEFVYRMPKGYKVKGDWDNKLYDSSRDFSDDAEYISWHMLIYQANYAYFAKGWTSYHSSEIAKLGPLEEAVVEFAQSTLNGLRGLLGLYSMNELIYNDGLRGSSAWIHGIMPKSWFDNVSTYFWVFQGLAWSLISLAIVKMLVQRNLATINTAMRMSLMDSIQDLLITGFILVNLLPLINMFMFLNVKVVDLFASLAPDFKNLSGLNNYSNAFSGIILQFFYFFIEIYLNFVYILRSITLAILITASPLFVVTLAFGAKWKPLFGTWMRELLSNIFIQSFHAFIFAFFLTTTWSSRGIESAVFCFALIPLTEFFRTLIMGQGAGILNSLGMKSVGAAAGIIGGSAMAIKSKRKDAKHDKKDSESSGSSSSSYSSGDGGSQRINRNSQNLNNRYNRPSEGSALETVQAQHSKEIPLGVFTRGSQDNASQEAVSVLQSYTGKPMTFTQAGLKDGAQKAVKGIVSKQNLKGVAKTAIGATAMGAGAGMALAYGASKGHLAGVGGSIAGVGAYKAGSGIADTGKSAGGGVVSGVGSMVKGISQDRAMKKVNNDVLNPPEINDGVTPGNATSQLNDYLHIKTFDDGSLDVHRDGVVLSEQGILRANDDGQGNAVYTYDMGKLSDEDRANIQYYADVFQNGTQEEKEWLRSNGIERVSANAQGQYMVAYNQIGKRQMGINSVKTLGSGKNTRIVESKNSWDPIATRKTINVPPMPSQPSQTNKNNNPTRNQNSQTNKNNNPTRNQNSQTNKNNNPNNNQFNK